MSLKINVVNSNSSNDLHHFQQSKPMAISSITSSPLPNSFHSTNNNVEATAINSSSSSVTSSPSTGSSNKNHHSNNSPSPPYASSSTPSSPDSPNFNSKLNQIQRFNPYPINHRHSYPQQQPKSYPFDDHENNYHPQQQSYHELYRTNSSNNGMMRYSSCPSSNIGVPTSIPAVRSASISSVLSSSTMSSSPLSLQERRQRNKAASAKYRAKKNQQHGEMRSLISSLTKENDLLQRQLDHLKRENERLKSTCDKYRGKILAEKMLKKLLNQPQKEKPEHEMDSSEDGMEEVEEDELIEHHESIPKYVHSNRTRFEEDIDFEDEEDQMLTKLKYKH